MTCTCPGAEGEGGSEGGRGSWRKGVELGAPGKPKVCV